MSSITSSAPVSKKMFWSGIVMSALPALLMVFSAIMKFAHPPAVVDGFNHLGLPIDLVIKLGVLEIACAVIYLIPRTAFLGAILVTAYLGGAIATTVRVGDAYLATVIAGVFVWGGLYLRDPRLRELIPLRS